MTLYRGQAYGESVGLWWTTSRDIAGHYARQTRNHVVLKIEVDGRRLRPTFERSGSYEYKLTPAQLKREVLAAVIVGGQLSTT